IATTISTRTSCAGSSAPKTLCFGRRPAGRCHTDGRAHRQRAPASSTFHRVKIVIPGGSGQIGQVLARAFLAGGHEVVVLSRAREVPAGRVVSWDGRGAGAWTR